MGSISDKMLSAGCAAHIAALHGEIIVVLSGDDAGKHFAAVQEIEPEVVEVTGGQYETRSKRVLRFRAPLPRLAPTDQVKTEDGRKWLTVKKPGDSYLTVDYELTEITKKDK